MFPIKKKPAIPKMIGFITTLALTAQGLLNAELAQAKSININPLSSGLNSSYLGLEDASLSDHAFSNQRTPGRKSIYLNFHSEKSPWVLLNKEKTKKVEDVVSSLQTLDMGFSWLLDDYMQVGIETFGSLVSVASQYGGESTTHIGDTRLNLKYRFLTDSLWSMAVMPELTLPTGVEYEGSPYGASISNSSFAPGVRLISEYRTTENQWTFNLGYTYYDKAEFKSPNQEYPRIDGRSRIFLGSGWLTRLSKNWALDSEYSTQIPASENHFTPPGLLTLGTRYQPSNSASWQFGLGSGSLGNKASGNDFVIYSGVKIPLFGGAARREKSPDQYEDPLIREAKKKELLDYSSDRRTLRSNDLDAYFNSSANSESNNVTVKRERFQKGL